MSADLFQQLYDKVNALGGVPATEYERGRNDTVGEVLGLIFAFQCKAEREDEQRERRVRSAIQQLDGALL